MKLKTATRTIKWAIVACVVVTVAFLAFTTTVKYEHRPSPPPTTWPEIWQVELYGEWSACPHEPYCVGRLEDTGRVMVCLYPACFWRK